MNYKETIKLLTSQIEAIEDVNEKIDAINFIRKEIHGVSPLNHHPVDFVMWAKSDKVEKNDYNPNHVDNQNLKALEQSVKASGYTMSIVGDLLSSTDNLKDYFVKIVDGFHRRKVERKNKEISKSTFGRVPVSFIRNNQKDKSARIAATVLHNRARGVHGIEPMSALVVELVQDGLNDSEIAIRLGMDADEVLRLKQLSGIADIFKKLNYTKSWEFKEI